MQRKAIAAQEAKAQKMNDRFKAFRNIRKPGVI
jgi:hypothetical protein